MVNVTWARQSMAEPHGTAERDALARRGIKVWTSRCHGNNSYPFPRALIWWLPAVIHIYRAAAAIKYSTSHGKRVRVSITSLDRHDRVKTPFPSRHDPAPSVDSREKNEGNRRRNLENAEQNSVNEKFVGEANFSRRKQIEVSEKDSRCKRKRFISRLTALANCR